MGQQNAEPVTLQDTLSSYLDNSAAAVRQTFVRYAARTHPHRPFIQHKRSVSFEKTYVMPIFDLLRALFLAYPIPFVSVF
jgi:hypothetical protein